MALFKRKDSGPKIPPEVAKLPWVQNPAPVDPDLGDPNAKAFRTALEGGDWRGASAALASATVGSRRYALTRSWDDPESSLRTAEQWLAGSPDDGWGRMVAGTLLTHWAWSARGHGYAETVDQSAWDVFFERLQRAESELLAASRLLPTETDPWNQLIWSGIGLQIPLEELAARFDEAHRRDPWEPNATLSMLQAVCDKWYGSNDKMFAFARMAATEAPDASPAIAALPMAHIEHMVARARDMPLPEAARALEEPDVRDELVRAAERSIFHPQYVLDARGLASANTFLVALYQGAHHREIQRVLDLLRGRYSERPFDYFGDPGRMARKCEILTARALGRPG